jgi:hypothetical protein
MWNRYTGIILLCGMLRIPFVGYSYDRQPSEALNQFAPDPLWF